MLRGNFLLVFAGATALRTLFFLVILASSAAAQDLARACGDAIQHHRAGKIQQAVDEYPACLAEYADAPPELRSNFGAALVQLGRYQEAIGQYQEALRAAPTNMQVRRNLALAYYKAGDMENAVAHFSSLREQAPEDLQIALILADCYLRTGVFQRVIEILAPLEPAHPADRALSYLLGSAYIQGGHVAEGQALVDRILRHGDSAEARFLLGNAAFTKHDYPRAVREFGLAVELNPALPTLQSFYGQSLLITGDADGAAAAFGKELAANPNDFDSNLQLGQILIERKLCAEALQYAKRAVLVRPKSFDARYALALCYECSGKAGDARREFKTLAGSAPGAASPHAGLARLYDQLHMPEDAARERQVAAQLSARVPRAANNNDGAPDLLPIGSLAPDFTLRRSSPAAQLRLSSLFGPKPTVLIFGSYSCQKFRFDAPAIESLYERYQRQAQFLLVYVHEAHSEESWQSSVNQREGVEVHAAKTLPQKEKNAAACARKLDLKFPVLIDGMDRHVESSYAGWPSAIYILGEDGHIVWRSRLGEQELSVSELERVMGELTSGR